MLITSNADFVSAGWAGDGSQGIPYTIEWLQFTSLVDEACISISDTTAYFRIMNCSFSPTTFGYGFKLNNAVNGEILYSIAGPNVHGIRVDASSNIQLSYLTLPNTCITIEQSSQCFVSCCTISYGPGDGVFLGSCSQMTIQGCEISDCAASGISLDNTGDTTISENSIQGNFLEQIYISGVSSVNRIHNNLIQTGTSGVRDNGDNNIWDNGVSIGNWWSDYGGSGYYYVPGTAGSVDRFPRGPTSTEPTIITTTTSTTSTTATTTTGNTVPGVGEVVVTSWAPLDFSVRMILALSIGLSYGALVLFIIKRLR